MADDEWGSARVDLGAYLARVGYRGDLEPSTAALRALHRAHVGAVPFENLDVVLGRPIELDVEALQAKLVRSGRGGYCYEQNLLFGAVLERLGFGVTRLAARVRMGSDAVRPTTHCCLRVEVDGTRWLADVGFGGEGLLEPLPLKAGTERRQGAWAFRLVTEERDGGWRLQSRHAQGWFDLYEFTEEPRHQVDYVLLNYFTATHPSSPFVTAPTVQRAGDEVRRGLRGTQLTSSGPDGEAERRDVSAEELPAVLASLGLVLPPADLARLQATTSA